MVVGAVKKNKNVEEDRKGQRQILILNRVFRKT